MNEIQKKAHTEGVQLVAMAFNKREKFNVEQAVSWVNSCIAHSTLQEELAVIERDPEGNMTQVHKLKASTAELCGYRLAGVFSGLESVRAGLAKRGVSIDFSLT